VPMDHNNDTRGWWIWCGCRWRHNAQQTTAFRLFFIDPRPKIQRARKEFVSVLVLVAYVDVSRLFVFLALGLLLCASMFPLKYVIRAPACSGHERTPKRRTNRHLPVIVTSKIPILVLGSTVRRLGRSESGPACRHDNQKRARNVLIVEIL
jgi:hypothetical protein